jgi:hypothetical protein
MYLVLWTDLSVRSVRYTVWIFLWKDRPLDCRWTDSENVKSNSPLCHAVEILTSCRLWTIAKSNSPTSMPCTGDWFSRHVGIRVNNVAFQRSLHKPKTGRCHSTYVPYLVPTQHSSTDSSDLALGLVLVRSSNISVRLIVKWDPDICFRELIEAHTLRVCAFLHAS